MIRQMWAAIDSGNLSAVSDHMRELPAVEVVNGLAIQVSASDGRWCGEVYDSRLETPGWDLPGFEDSSWSPVRVVDGSNGIRSSQMMPPIRVRIWLKSANWADAKYFKINTFLIKKQQITNKSSEDT